MLLPGMVLAFLAFVEPCQGTKDSRSSKELFLDKTLEAAVREGVYSKRGTTKPLTEGDLRCVSKVFAKGKKIRDLRGLERCSALTTLDLSDNTIADLAPLSGLKNLRGLFLSKNQINDLKPLSSLTGLETLDLDDNQIVDLKPLSGLTKLKTLCLADNRISNPDSLSGLVQLWCLTLGGNRISTLSSLSPLTHLRILSLKGNRIADLSPIAVMEDLRFLFLENNQIRDLGALVDMAKRDVKGDQRLAPFWNICLSGNPLSDIARTSQAAELRRMGVTLKAGDNSKS